MLKYKGTVGFIALIFGLGVAVLFSHFSSAQVAVTEVRNATLLREYFLPIQALAPIEEGRIVIGPNECASLYSTAQSTKTTEGVYGKKEYRPTIMGDTDTCADKVVDEGLGFSPAISVENAQARKTTQGFELSRGNITVQYNVTVVDSSVYQLTLGAFNRADAFDRLTRTEYLAIKDQINNSYPEASVLKGDPSIDTELQARRLFFQIALNDPENIIDVVSFLDTGLQEFGSVTLGLLPAGQHKIFITYANDLDGVTIPNAGVSCVTIDACGSLLKCEGLTSETLGTCSTLSADVNGDGRLDKTPVITSLTLSKTKQTNDVIGVRVYTNPQHLSAFDWYRQNLVNQGNPVPFEVDGYTGVLDQRTAYINAANVAVPAGATEPSFFTNIYVIAHNINASPQTIEIFNRIIENWKFNKNIIEQEAEVEGERIKNQLRRDTKRLEDLNTIRTALENYKLRNGKYPALETGTFERGHVISTWQTWQSVLGNQLEVLLPIDPLNVMASDFYSRGSALPAEPRQYDCTDEYEGKFCENICVRDATNIPLWGCPADQQCVGQGAEGYCSLIPPGYDPVTGWNVESQELWFNADANPTGRYQVKNFQGTIIEGPYNTNGVVTDVDSIDKYQDDAFVYQYMAVDGGESYQINYRLEYRGTCTERRPDGSCKTFSNTRCGAGSCFIEEQNVCLQPGQGVYEALNNNGEYRNLYCFAGSIINSCGNGILQPDAGETCEFNSDFADGKFCDSRYLPQDWYNEANISQRCTTSCQIADEVEKGALPVPYNPQTPGLSCGGYCGDGITQFEYGEECDLGPNGGRLELPVRGGSAGVSADAQYECLGVTGTSVGTTTELVKQGSFEITNDDLVLEVLEDNTSNTPYNPIVGRWLYTQNPPPQITTVESRVGSRSLLISTDISQIIPVQQMIPYTFSGFARFVNLSSDNGQNKNVVFSIRFFDDNGQLLEIPEGKSAQSIVLSKTNGRVGWTPVLMQVVSPQKAAYAKISVSLSNNEDNPAIYIDDLSLTATPGCQTFGGYCGDGQVQSQYGEQCDPLSHVPPTPQRSVDQIVNGGFEQGLQGGWVEVSGNGGLVATEDQSYLSLDIVQSSAGIDMAQFIASGDRAAGLIPSKSGAGIGQRVQYIAGSTVTLRADIRAELFSNSTAPLRPQMRLYQYDFGVGVVVPFSTGENYLVEPMVVSGTRGNITDRGAITTAYSTFTGEITIPQGIVNQPNTATIAAVALVAPNATDGDEITQQVKYFIDNVSIDSDYRLQYACTTVNNRQCQLTGGSCGDGIMQPQFGEACDLGPANGTGKVVNGQVCSRYCSFPFCGDGLKSIRVDIAGQVRAELCDASDPTDLNRNFCNFDCSALKVGASCQANSQCESKNCIAGRCAPKLGEAGCDPNKPQVSCPDGSVCDPQSSICRPSTDNYLSYHFDPNGIPYGESSLNCPILVTKVIGVGSNQTKVLRDECTGLEFDVSDRGKKENHFNAKCDRGFRIPTVKELFTLATGNVDDNGWPYLESDQNSTYTDNDILNFCSLNGNRSTSGLAGHDQCLERLDDRYLYWTSTPYGGQLCYSSTGKTQPLVNGECSNGLLDYEGYYAVDFKKKTVDVVAPNKKLWLRCVSDVKCGDGIIQGDEQCEFSAGIEVVQNKACALNAAAQSLAPYNAGNVHCDPKSCKLRFDNCVIVTDPSPNAGFCQDTFESCDPKNNNCAGGAACISKNSCEAICSGINYVEETSNTVKSYGVNLTENYPGRQSTVNTDPNRRPERVSGGYHYDDSGDAVYDTTATNSSYAVADDGLYVTLNDQECTFVKDRYESSQFEKSCSFGLKVIEPVTNWNQFDLYNSTQQTTAQFTNLSGSRTLCNCEVPQREIITATGGADTQIVRIIQEVRELVEIAELSIGKSNFLFHFSLAQYGANDANDELRASGGIASDDQYFGREGVEDLFEMLTQNTDPAIELQSRLNLLAEQFVFGLENELQFKQEAFSRWTFDEGRNRTSYNVGPNRTSLSQGSGGNIRATTIQGGTLNLEWRPGKFNGIVIDEQNVRLGALYLNGDDYMYTDAGNFMPINDANNDAQNGSTLSLWYRLDTTQNRQALWSIAAGANNFYRLVVENNAVRFECNGGSLTSSSSATAQTWRHVALVFDNQMVTLYDNSTTGQSISCTSFPQDLTNVQQFFGAAADASGAVSYHAIGAFDEIRMYEHILSSEDISTLLDGSDIDLETGELIRPSDLSLDNTIKTVYTTFVARFSEFVNWIKDLL